MARRILAMHVIAVLALILAMAPPVAAQPAQFASANVQNLWQRYDLPVAARQTTRSWTWGPTSLTIRPEQYINSPGGQRTVQYFDKARMEINDPTSGAVSSGLLVRELVSGRLALGDVAFEQRVPSTQVVAGDPVTINPGAASYGDFAGVASIDADRRAPNRANQVVNQGIGTDGQVYVIPQSTLDQFSLNNIRYTFYEPTLGHNMPNVFIDFVNQQGVVYENGQYVPNQPLFSPWISVMGLPITEPYWTRTLVNGKFQVLLVQLFERRVLTYNALNQDGFKVEMGNVGQHFLAWRDQPPPPPPPPPPPVTPDAPVFTAGPQRTDLTATTARIEWSTNEPTTTLLSYDTDSNQDTFRNRTGDGRLRTSHVVNLTGLAPNTVYFWRVEGRDSSGQQVPDNTHSFRTLQTSGGGTFITSPTTNQRVSSPLTVSGQEDGSAFERSVLVRLRDVRTGHIYAQQPAQVQGTSGPGPFSVTLYFTQPTADEPAVVEVISQSPVDGEPAQLRASVNVRVAGTGGTPPPPSGSNTISRPTPGLRVGTPLRVIGTVDSTPVGGQLLVQILDANTLGVVNEVYTTANSRGEFNVLIDYVSPSRNHPGIVQVVAVDTVDGRRFVPLSHVDIIMA